MQHSPYTPGETAYEIPGRERQLTDIAGTLARVALDGAFAGRIPIDIGPRGVGKTSLLRHVQRSAADLGLATVFVTAGNGTLTADLADEIATLGRTWGQGDVLLDRIEEVKLTADVPGVGSTEVSSGRGTMPGTTRASRELVADAARSALTDGDRRGLVLLVDEFQASDAESLRTLAYAWQELRSGDAVVPAAFLAAGLSHTPDVVTRAVTHSERFQYRPMRDLDPPATRTALTSPATNLGVAWTTEAMEAVVERAQGYPYFIQLYGDEVWRAAGFPDPGGRLTADHLALAQDIVDIDLTELYRTRWAKTTAKEREILTVMAEHGEPSVPRRDTAARLGVESSAISMARQSLLDKGIVDSPAYGTLAFTVPGFGAYLRSLTTD